MNDTSDLATLKGDLLKTLEKIRQIERFYLEFKQDASQLPANKPYGLIVLADIFVDFYTCVETGFVRVSKCFENNLEPARWHSRLLENMTLDVPGIRPRLLSNHVFSLLLEFLKFRHFRRYYFAYEYDRDRMAFLENKFTELLPALRDEITAFLSALDRIAQ